MLTHLFTSGAPNFPLDHDCPVTYHHRVFLLKISCRGIPVRVKNQSLLLYTFCFRRFCYTKRIVLIQLDRNTLDHKDVDWFVYSSDKSKGQRRVMFSFRQDLHHTHIIRHFRKNTIDTAFSVVKQIGFDFLKKEKSTFLVAGTTDEFIT